MPELPEVETTIRHLKPLLLDRMIEQIVITPRGERHFNKPVAEVRAALEGATLRDLTRVGKWMLFDFDRTKVVGHLRMSGRYTVSRETNPSLHLGFNIILDNGDNVGYLDQRRFGTFHLVDEFAAYPYLSLLGPDALSPAFNVEYLAKRLTKVKRNIYQALLDQTIVAGLGNIYVNETLNLAEIHPLTPANKLNHEQIANIVMHAKEILNLALTLKGTTLADNLYQDIEGRRGKFHKMLKVYGKHKHPDIEVLKIGGRSAFVHKNTKLTTN